MSDKRPRSSSLFEEDFIEVPISPNDENLPSTSRNNPFLVLPSTHTPKQQVSDLRRLQVDTNTGRHAPSPKSANSTNDRGLPSPYLPNSGVSPDESSRGRFRFSRSPSRSPVKRFSAAFVRSISPKKGSDRLFSEQEDSSPTVPELVNQPLLMKAAEGDLDAINDGLNTALGTDGTSMGQWLNTDQYPSSIRTSRSLRNSNIPRNISQSRSPSKSPTVNVFVTNNAPYPSFDTSYNSTRTPSRSPSEEIDLGTDRNSQSIPLKNWNLNTNDLLSVVEDGNAQDALLSPRNSSPARHLSLALKNISSRIVKGTNDSIQHHSSIRSNTSLVPKISINPYDDDNSSLPNNKRGSAPPLSPSVSCTTGYSLHEETGFPGNESTNNLSIQEDVPEELPLFGRSLSFFDDKHSVRVTLAKLIMNPWFEPVVFFSIIIHTIVLTYREWSPSTTYKYTHYGKNWVDYIILAINLFYTVEILAKIIVFGLWDDREMFKELGLHRGSTFSKYFQTKKQSEQSYQIEKPISHSFHIKQKVDKEVNNKQRKRAFLRNSWNRVDLTSVLSFWLSLFFSINHFDDKHHFYVFRALGCLRILRLVNVTHGTVAILNSMKAAAPFLIDMSIFMLFFLGLFGIIGVQSFKSSFRRQCMWVNPEDSQDTYTHEFQFCGGYLAMDSSNEIQMMPYLNSDGTSSGIIKGFMCPLNSICQSRDNPYGGTVSFDNFAHSFELAFVIMSLNTFSDLMYYTMDSDNTTACLFFMFGIIFLGVWIMNLFIAVIVSGFKITRDEMRSAAPMNLLRKSLRRQKLKTKKKPSPLLKLYFKTSWIWLVFITISLITQCFRTSTISEEYSQRLLLIELFVTYVLCLEILLRIFSYLPDWRSFYLEKRNIFDLFLAIITGIIAIPHIRKTLGHAYYWLSVFQIVRFYRIVLAIPFARTLWRKVLGNVKSIANLSFFYILITFLCSIITSVYFTRLYDEDEIQNNFISFYTLPNTFVGLYQISSTENWTTILYGMQEATSSRQAKVFGAILLVLWFVLSQNIVLNIFIAVIAENLEVTEKEKKRQQVKQFMISFSRKLKAIPEESVLSRMKNRVFKRKPSEAHNQAAINLLLNGLAVNDFLKGEQHDENDLDTKDSNGENIFQLTSSWKRLFSPHHWKSYTMFSIIGNPFYRPKKDTAAKTFINPSTLMQDVVKENANMAADRNKYLKNNPNFNVVLWLFPPKHPLRRLCQLIVRPSTGNNRKDGVYPNKRVREAFSVFMFCATVALVTLACITTPLYRINNGLSYSIFNWTLYVDIALLGIFNLEFLIKVIADGFLLTPNAYMRSSWNIFDLIVLITLWINFLAVILGYGKLARAVRGFKALRALRLLTISERAKNTFHSIIVAGGGKIFGAAMIAITLLFPFSIWGLNVLNGRLSQCVDNSLSISECINEYNAEVFNWNIVSPTSWGNSYYDFDTFFSSFQIFFEMVSLEGWIDVLQAAFYSTGVGTPQAFFATPINGVFIMFFNLVSTVFILTLFISVIIDNYSKTTGSAYMTDEQRSWYEIAKVLKLENPYKRPTLDKLNILQRFCYKNAVLKPPIWRHSFDIVLCIHVILLLSESFPEHDRVDDARYILYIVTSSAFLVSNLMRLIALGPKRYFTNKRNIFESAIITGAFVMSVCSFFISRDTYFANFNKLFLLGILFLIIPRIGKLDQLMKTATASLPSIISLLFTWAVLFLVWAIAMNQIFGLTKIGSNGSGNINFRTVPKALIVLFRMSFGEGWNDIMFDYMVESPNCIDSDDIDSTDCGSRPWAYLLFVSWNIISMYIFLNLFVSLITESFRYVYQHSGLRSSLTHSEIQKFKEEWHKFDENGTGYIEPSELPTLLRNIDGVLSFKIYDGVLSVKELEKRWFIRKSNDPYDVVSHEAIKDSLSSSDIEAVRTQRALYERFIEEALLKMELANEPGISFTNVLLQIPLYNMFDETNCLKLEDFLERHLLTRKVKKRLQDKRVLSAIRTISCRFKYLHNRDITDQVAESYLPININKRKPILRIKTDTFNPTITVSGYKDEISKDDNTMEYTNTLTISTSPYIPKRSQKPYNFSQSHSRSRSRTKGISYSNGNEVGFPYTPLISTGASMRWTETDYEPVNYSNDVEEANDSFYKGSRSGSRVDNIGHSDYSLMESGDLSTLNSRLENSAWGDAIDWVQENKHKFKEDT